MSKEIEIYFKPSIIINNDNEYNCKSINSLNLNEFNILNLQIFQEQINFYYKIYYNF